MSKLLNEATVRRFMKLASIDTLSDGFVVNEGSYGGDMSNEDYMKEEDEIDAEEAAVDMNMDMEAGAEADMGMEAGAGDVSEEDVVDIVATIANALEDKYGIAVDVEGGAEEAETGMEVDADADVADVPDAPADEMEAEVEDEEELEMMEMVDDEVVVAEVLKRVTARLRKAIKENKKTKITRK